MVAAAVMLVPANAGAKTDGTVDSYYWENDALYHQDRHYTNGFKFTSLHEPGDISDEHMARLIHRILPLVEIEPEQGVQKRFGKVVGQNIYTPQHIEDPQPIFEDRPYAGWLYGGYVLVSYTERGFRKLEVDAGFVGPLSLAEQTQKLVHRAGGWTIPEGWDHQLRTEPGIIVLSEDRFKVQGNPLFNLIEYDMIPHAGWSAGNIMTNAAVGNMVRIGYHLPNDFGNGHICPTAAPLKLAPALRSGEAPENGKMAWGAYVFGDVEGRWVLRNIFLDGNTWRSSQHVNKVPFVSDVEFGAAVIIGEAEIAYRQVSRSREFKQQVGDNKFSSLSVTVRF
jgi:lipid A 3-O-deacylase